MFLLKNYGERSNLLANPLPAQGLFLPPPGRGLGGIAINLNTLLARAGGIGLAENFLEIALIPLIAQLIKRKNYI